MAARRLELQFALDAGDDVPADPDVVAGVFGMHAAGTAVRRALNSNDALGEEAAHASAAHLRGLRRSHALVSFRGTGLLAATAWMILMKVVTAGAGVR